MLRFREGLERGGRGTSRVALKKNRTWATARRTTPALAGMVVPDALSIPPSIVHLAHTKFPPNRTLQQPYAWGPMLILWEWVFLMGEVPLLTINLKL